ncbi:MAG: hypothetical protein QXW58_06635 [Thermosphaera sp.]
MGKGAIAGYRLHCLKRHQSARSVQTEPETRLSYGKKCSNHAISGKSGIRKYRRIFVSMVATEGRQRREVLKQLGKNIYTFIGTALTTLTESEFIDLLQKLSTDSGEHERRQTDIYELSTQQLMQYATQVIKRIYAEEGATGLSPTITDRAMNNNIWEIARILLNRRYIRIAISTHALDVEQIVKTLEEIYPDDMFLIFMSQDCKFNYHTIQYKPFFVSENRIVWTKCVIFSISELLKEVGFGLLSVHKARNVLMIKALPPSSRDDKYILFIWIDNKFKSVEEL